MTTAYDAVSYPATLFSHTHPDHLGAVARLHGLDAPAAETARVLEVAGGDGVNLIGMAAAYPRASFYSFDLSSAATARGRNLVAAAGLDNIRVEVGDILALADTIEEQFDYVIVHGLYAWVPEVVQQATMRLVGRVLVPEGVAMISYNALPGGYLRMAIRDMLLHRLQGIDEPEARVRRAREVLAEFAQAHEHDRPVLSGMRDVARPMLAKQFGFLFHDELGECYQPRSLTEVVTAAEAEGLAFLNDASPLMLTDGLPGEDWDDAAVVSAAQTSDYESMAFFHQSLFVRAGRRPARRFDHRQTARLYASCRVERTGPLTFLHDGKDFEVGDALLADTLAELASIWPARLPLTRFADLPDHCESMIRLFRADVVALAAGPLPATLAPGERPVSNPVARAQIEAGQRNLFTLDHRIITFEAPGPRLFLSMLDGSRDRAQLARDWLATDYGHEVDVDTALAQLARIPMLLA